MIEALIWPRFHAPAQYENADPDWEDPALPDFAKLFEVARSVGYSIALHGSMRRDVDLVAIPWTEDALSPAELARALCAAVNARQVGDFEIKPHGRVAVTLQVDGYVKPIDLSIMSRHATGSPDRLQELRETLDYLADCLDVDALNETDETKVGRFRYAEGVTRAISHVAEALANGEPVKLSKRWPE